MSLRASTSYFHIQILLSGGYLQGLTQNISMCRIFNILDVYKGLHIIFSYPDSFICEMSSRASTRYFQILILLHEGCLQGTSHHILIFRFFYLLDVFKCLHAIFLYSVSFISRISSNASTIYFHIEIL